MKPTSLTVTTDAAFIAAGNPNTYYARVHSGAKLVFESVRLPNSTAAVKAAERWIRGTLLPHPTTLTIKA